ncbi:MAG: hypothetical protein HY724_02095 [Candidatus Rokubacteria bacterium]|nr:hypothetical protein [Candidatus Rokubacteria bacterium]
MGLGDSLTHGTMDATNNATNTLNAYLQKVADSLAQVTPLLFSQPLFNERGHRLTPFRLPTNLGVDGADAFSLEGLEYYKRAGTDESFITGAYLADELWPWRLKDTSDKVVYPINLLPRQPVSQLFLFKDPEDNDPAVEPRLPPDVWEQISDLLLREILDIPVLRTEAERRGVAPRK